MALFVYTIFVGIVSSSTFRTAWLLLLSLKLLYRINFELIEFVVWLSRYTFPLFNEHAKDGLGIMYVFYTGRLIVGSYFFLSLHTFEYCSNVFVALCA